MTKAPYAVQARDSRGRQHAQPDSDDRSPYQRDRDRVVHCSAFRKLQYKTQVFVTREGDFYRTRLTHSLEVAQIARSIARTLGLDEDLTECLALAHDLGHPPFGHAGERGLNEALKEFGGFDHNDQSFRVVTLLEQRYAAFDGLNLSWETLEGLAKHNGPLKNPPPTIAAFNEAMPLDLNRQTSAEAQVAAFSDDVAYNTHDLDDGLRAGLFEFEDLLDLPVIGDLVRRAQALTTAKNRIRHELSRSVINTLVHDALKESERRLAALNPQSTEDIRNAATPVIGFSEEIRVANVALKRFLFARMYRHWRVNRQTHKAEHVTKTLANLLLHQPNLLPDDWRDRAGKGGTAQAAEVVRDYVAGMTDRYALDEFSRLTDPSVPA
ncbi:deoxyguanosinetriphosphate triphosphohydrolase [Acidocella aromatica]|uniref:Deoxyguanosinetriphosphate triphosphohydrolase-like protein n=1 Tax=Acidocella aromatica TaxID=1303579 RepID=A0A840V762_9PROT|nr:deoxyguanosinetriphosphate triphosphohydrolase [Acidocella aromatica]MBB5371818.1 dGTPase [Acidocella aromatica]